MAFGGASDIPQHQLELFDSTVRRLHTFTVLPDTSSLIVRPVDLAENFFICRGRDKLECVLCRKQVVNWQLLRKADIMSYHSPECASRTTFRSAYESDKPMLASDNHSPSQLPEDDIEGDLSELSLNAQSVPVASYSGVDVDLATEGVAQAVTPLRIQERSRDASSVRNENVRMREQITCKKCHQNRVETLFLPCRHLVSCEACAEQVDNCLLCNSKILGTVRTFLI